jgi:hypothetical protein
MDELAERMSTAMACLKDVEQGYRDYHAKGNVLLLWQPSR